MGMLVACNFMNYMDRQVLSAVVPALRQEFLTSREQPVLPPVLQSLHPSKGKGEGNTLLGVLMLCFMGAYMLLAPIFGVLPFKRWRIIGFGIILWSLATGMSGFSRTFDMLLLSRCLVGVGEAAYGPLAPAMIADLYPIEKRATMLALFMLAMPCGSAVGYILGGAVSDRLGWRWAFYLPVLPGLLLGILCFLMPQPNSTEEAHHSSRKGNFFKDFALLLKTKSFLYTMGALTAMTFCLGALGYWMPSYANEYRHAGSLAQVNVIFGLMVLVTGISGTYLGGYMVDRLRPLVKNIDFLFPTAALALAAPLFALSLYLPFPWAWGFIGMTCFFLFVAGAPMNAIIANVVPSSLRPVAFGLNILVIHLLGDAISPMLIGAIADARDMHTAFLSLIAVDIAAIAFCILGSRYIVKDMESMTSAQT
jgi:MFS transporter, Spinster family, sphingosine-1-phosphate transporter